MFIRNLKFDSDNYYKCNRKVANYLFEQGFIEISNDDGMVVFQNTDQLKAALKLMPIRLKIMAEFSKK